MAMGVDDVPLAWLGHPNPLAWVTGCKLNSAEYNCNHTEAMSAKTFRADCVARAGVRGVDSVRLVPRDSRVHHFQSLPLAIHACTGTKSRLLTCSYISGVPQTSHLRARSLIMASYKSSVTLDMG